VGFVFAQLHYTTKRLLPFFFWMQPFLLFFYSASCEKIYDYVLHDISKITVPRFGCSEELIE
jgi:hypothetical protein